MVIDGLSRWVPCPLPAAFLPPLLTCWASYHLAVPVSPQACDYTAQEALAPPPLPPLAAPPRAATFCPAEQLLRRCA